MKTQKTLQEANAIIGSDWCVKLDTSEACERFKVWFLKETQSSWSWKWKFYGRFSGYFDGNNSTDGGKEFTPSEFMKLVDEEPQRKIIGYVCPIDVPECGIKEGDKSDREMLFNTFLFAGKINNLPIPQSILTALKAEPIFEESEEENNAKRFATFCADHFNKNGFNYSKLISEQINELYAKFKEAQK